MRVDLLYFGMLKDLLGRERESLKLLEGATVGDLLDGARARAEGAVWGTLAVAVNREYAGRGTVLHDGDEVALLPPVSGGSFEARIGEHPTLCAEAAKDGARKGGGF